MVIKQKYEVHDPPPMQTQNIPSRDNTKYCGFHQDYDHTTENCIQLERAIEKLIWEGHLKEYLEGKTKEKIKRVIEVITAQLFSIKQIKRKIHDLEQTCTDVSLRQAIPQTNNIFQSRSRAE